MNHGRNTIVFPAMSRNTLVARAAERAVPVLLEGLEQRRHLSASLSGDKLVIETGAGNDTVELTLGGNGATIDVQESGSLQSFSTAAVKSIEISTGAGNDRVTLSNQVITFTKPQPKTIKLPS